MKRMSFILDIDLDYFGLFNDPIIKLVKILRWADRPLTVLSTYTTRPSKNGPKPSRKVLSTNPSSSSTLTSTMTCSAKRPRSSLAISYSLPYSNGRTAMFIGWPETQSIIHRCGFPNPPGNSLVEDSALGHESNRNGQSLTWQLLQPARILSAKN